MSFRQDDTIFVAGHLGMAGSAITRAFYRAGYKKLITASKSDLNLLDSSAVDAWFTVHKPTVVVSAAAKVGICANSNYPADFLLDNLKIQITLLKLSLWSATSVSRAWLCYPKLAAQPMEEDFLTGVLSLLISGTQLPRLLASSVRCTASAAWF